MSQNRDLEHAVEQYTREVYNAKREVAALLKTIAEIENLAAAADQVDLRNSFSLKSDLRQLQNEVNELTRYVRDLADKLNDANSTIRKALY